ncbi:MAG: AI-2E family transporter [Lachnoclostridium sp.]
MYCGKASASLGLGIVSYIGFLILGLPYAILLATVIAITNLVPYIGPIVGAVPPILIALTAGDTRLAIGTAVFIIICQQIEGNILTPLLTGDALQVSPLLLLVGIAVFGAR